MPTCVVLVFMLLIKKGIFIYLKRFFGNIRQVGGCNDHPATPTVLQIYKILSTFGILKPPSSGNCTIIKNINNKPLISLSQLKEMYTKSGHNSRQLLLKIKEKLNNAIQNEAWDFENYVEHDYSLPEVVDCVIYCFTANMAHKMLAFVKDCSVCTNALLNSEEYTNNCDAMFFNMINEDQIAPFAHPNKNFYLFIRSLEQLFVKHSNSMHVFEEVINEALPLNLFTFPCTLHKDDVIPLIIQNYIQTRMIQNCKKINEVPKTISAEKKKSAKYYVH